MREMLKTYFAGYDIDLTEKQIDQFEKYYAYLIEENQKFNLTAITEKKDVVIKHFIDSVLPWQSIPQNAKVIDVGTGAGFPGIPLKILRPDINLTLLDSLKKRVDFLSRTCNLLNLSNVECVHSRAEDYACKNREKFDIALSRAVASIPTLSEYLLPFVKKGGYAVMYKGSKADEELTLGQKAIKILGGNLDQILKFSLTEVESERNIILIKKVAKTDPKYPRGKNLPKTKPLM